MDRATLLAELLTFQRSLPDVLRELGGSQPPTGHLAALTQSHLVDALALVRAGRLSFGGLVAWAMEVELMEDIGREEEWRGIINTVLFEMASPELDSRSEERRLNDWRGQLLGLNVGTVRTNVRAAPKHPSIVEVIEALALGANGWVETDTWDGDLFAVGIARADDPRRLVYVSTCNKPRGRY